ncbi:MAG: radical SAM protein [Methylophilaceae bacterium]|nr:radical SAM protein [Methylophilaceae bacterium]
MALLTVHDHTRDTAGHSYVYPVVSRRAGGVSVGINLNPNNACNWACIYCQVPGLTRGDAPPIDLARLEAELREFLEDALHGDWLARHAPEEARMLKDIAFSGNGEPTSSREFPEAVRRVGKVLDDCGVTGMLKVRLITNGSLMHRGTVLDAVAAMAAMNGEVWFKLDRATSRGMAEVNRVRASIAGVKRRLLACAGRCPTWVQTCWFALDGQPPAEAEVEAYLDFIEAVGAAIAGVHLYGIARPSMQPGAERLSPLPLEVLSAYGERIRQRGVAVTVHA